MAVELMNADELEAESRKLMDEARVMRHEPMDDERLRELEGIAFEEGVRSQSLAFPRLSNTLLTQYMSDLCTLTGFLGEACSEARYWKARCIRAESEGRK